jgi:hypothetical protein
VGLGQLGDDVAGDQLEMIKVVDVKSLQVDARHSEVTDGTQSFDDLVGCASELAFSQPRERLANGGGPTLQLSLIASAADGQGEGTPQRGRVAASGANGTLNSSAYVAARRGVVLAPRPPTMTGGCGSWNGRGSAGFASIE